MTAPITEQRPWGSYTILLDAPYVKVKEITVNPGQKLSLQTHEKRDEHWVVVKGVGRVHIGHPQPDGTFTPAIPYRMYPKYHIDIDRGKQHRMENCGTEPLIFIEVQTGDYFGEDDIKRYEDDYKRV